MGRRSLVRLFSDTWAQLFNTNDPELNYNLEEKIQPVVVVGTSPTASGTLTTQALRVVTTPPFSGDAGVPVYTMPTGLSIIATSGSLAGNAGLDITTTGTTSGATYEVWAYIYSYKCSGDIAARTTAAANLGNLYPGYVIALTNGPIVYTSATLSLTAGQDGSVALVPGGIETKNQNGTVTYAASKLMFPLTATATTQISGTVAAATNGQAADIHQLSLIGRRVA